MDKIITFTGSPKYTCKVDYKTLSITKFFKDLKEDIVLEKVSRFTETEKEISFIKNDYYTDEKYIIKKEELPEGILFELHNIMEYYLEQKEKKARHPIFHHLRKIITKERSEWKDLSMLDKIAGDYNGILEANFLCTILNWCFWILYPIAAVSVVASFFSIPTLIGGIIFSTIVCLTKLNFHTIKTVIKEIYRLATNRKYFKKSIKVKKVKRRKVVSVKKNNKKTNNLKQNIVDEIKAVQDLISKLSTENEKLYQRKLYELLEEYKNKVQEVRNQKSDSLVLVYELDIDKAFFQSLINLEAEINIRLTTSDSNKYKEYDEALEKIEKTLKESLGEPNNELRSMGR